MNLGIFPNIPFTITRYQNWIPKTLRTYTKILGINRYVREYFFSRSYSYERSHIDPTRNHHKWSFLEQNNINSTFKETNYNFIDWSRFSHNLQAKIRVVSLKNKLITDNAMLDLDILQHIYNSSSLDTTLKLDILKVFDRVEWTYFKYIMQQMWFPTKFKSLIMQCISTTNIAIRFNMTRTDYIIPSRGLRQRDPLSPLLFVLCKESFSKILEHACVEGWWNHNSPWNGGLKIYHLVFVDDIILFSKATKAGMKEI